MPTNLVTAHQVFRLEYPNSVTANKKEESDVSRLRALMSGILPHFFFAWLTAGFCGGAVVLLMIAIPFEESLREHGWGQNAMNLMLSAIALSWVIASGLFAWNLVHRWAKGARLWLAHGALVILCAVVFNMFLKASTSLVSRFRGQQVSVTDRFVFGPFPDRVRTEDLKREGFTGIITLLSPLVPFEAVLLEQEREDARAAGLKLIETPMLPWVSSNHDALEKIRAIAREPSGRYYVHCYLGRHRADLAKFVIMEEADAGSARGEMLPARLGRGPVVYFGDTIVLGPAPTRDEWFENIVRAGVRRVFVLNDADTVPSWAINEDSWASSAGITVRVFPMNGPADGARIISEMQQGRGLVYIHSFYADERLKAFEKILDPAGAYAKRIPPEHDPLSDFLARIELSPSNASPVLPAMLERGPVRIFKEGWAVGPLPTKDEWSDVFAASGVRNVISLLNSEDETEQPWIAEEQGEIERLGMNLLVLPAKSRIDLIPVMRAARSIPGPLYIHSFKVDEKLVRLMELIEHDAPMPDSLERGAITSSRGGVHKGPLPTPDEWLGVLAPSGVRSVVTLMDESDPGNQIWFDQIRHAVSVAGFEHYVAGRTEDPAEVRRRIEKLRQKGGVYVHAYRSDDPRLAAY